MQDKHAQQNDQNSSSSSEDTRVAPSTPVTPMVRNPDSPLLSTTPSAANLPNHPPTMRHNSSQYIKSPLGPNAAGSLPRSRPASRGSFLNRLASEEYHAFSGANGSNRGSMLLYRLATDDDQTSSIPSQLLTVPTKRFSIGSDSVLSLESKYPGFAPRGMVPYVYDPELDDKNAHDPDDEAYAVILDEQPFGFSWRGIANVGLLILLIAALLCLFILYPVVLYLRNNSKNFASANNARINGTGQFPVLDLPPLIDPETPQEVRTRVGLDGQDYELVFSDEFNKDGRTFWPGDDPFWEAVDLWYGATADLEWYDPGNVFTRDGALVIQIDNVPYHDLQYRSGMLQSWNKFCFTGGYIEVALSLPGPGVETEGYWPGVWTMGNLGRPGYGATTDGTWPYTYNSCDVGTLPNQTEPDGSGPAAALHTDEGRDRYNFELSWLTGQKMSACTCPGEDHPGPRESLGRGAPEIDVIEAQKNKIGPGAKVSQSAQFAPFSHDYFFDDSSPDYYEVFDPAVTQPNRYRGSAVQQAISTLTDVPPELFNGSGGQYGVFGFEYWSNPAQPEQGYITWLANGVPSVHVGADAVRDDPLPEGSGVGRRLIPEEPMSIVFNLAISESFQDVVPASMVFPNEFRIDYVRVYQRTDSLNVGCDPPDYPTADYISRHQNAYTNANLTTWQEAGYTFPRNSLLESC